MKRKRRTKHEVKNLQEKINKLVREGFSYSEIAEILKMKKGKQLVAYHFRKSKKVGSAAPETANN